MHTSGKCTHPDNNGIHEVLYLSILFGFGVVIVYNSMLFVAFGSCDQNGRCWVAFEILV